MTARHQGIEFDGVYKVFKNLSIEGMANIADWEWISKAYAAAYNDAGVLLKEQTVDPTGTKVGDAAQITYAASFRYEPIKKLYIKPQFNFFGKNYSNINLVNDYTVTNSASSNNVNFNIGRQPWRMPNYWLLDVNAGYSFNVWKVKMDARLSVINALNTFYISDAQNNNMNSLSSFNVNDASVNVGMGRRWQISLVATF